MGTTLEVAAPVARATLDLHVFNTARSGARIAVESSWVPEESHQDGSEIDLDVVLDLADALPRADAGVVAFSRDGASVRLLASQRRLRRGVATRVCRTPESAPFEIVAFGAGEAVLIRPDVIRKSESRRGKCAGDS